MDLKIIAANINLIVLLGSIAAIGIGVACAFGPAWSLIVVGSIAFLVTTGVSLIRGR